MNIDELKNLPFNKPSARLVYLAIEEEADAEGWASFSYSELAKIVGMTRHGLYRLIQNLKEERIIEQRSDKENYLTTNSYRTIK